MRPQSKRRQDRTFRLRTQDPIDRQVPPQRQSMELRTRCLPSHERLVAKVVGLRSRQV